MALKYVTRSYKPQKSGSELLQVRCNKIDNFFSALYYFLIANSEGAKCRQLNRLYDGLVEKVG